MATIQDQRTSPGVKTGALLAVLGALMTVLGFAAMTIESGGSGGFVLVAGSVLLVGGLLLNEIASRRA
jgi:hypothetical protein